MNGVSAVRCVALILLTIPAALGQNGDSLEPLARARRWKSQGAMRNALEAYQGVLPEIRNSPAQDLLLQVLMETTQAAIAVGEYRGAIATAGEAAQVANRLQDRTREGAARNLLGQANLYQGSYSGALEAFRQAFDLAEAEHDVNAACIRLGNIGNVHFFQGRYLDALHNYELALQKSETADAKASNGRQLALANLAILYEQLGQNEKALSYYQRAQTSASALEPSEYAQLLSNMGTLYRRMGDPVKALDTYSAARQVFRGARHSDGEIHVLHNTGLVLALDYKSPERALPVFTEALKLAEATTNRRQSMLGRLFRGEALLRMDRVAEARAEYREALAGAVGLGAAEEQWNAQYGIGRTYDRAGDKRLAASAYRDAIVVIEKLRAGLGASTLKTEFLGNKRSVYDAYIDSLLNAGSPDVELMFELFEKARSRNLQDALSRNLERATIPSIQRRLDDRSMLVEYWVGPSRAAALWMTDRASGIVQTPLAPEDLAGMQNLARGFTDGADASWKSEAAALARLLLNGLPLDTRRANLLIVPDGVLCSAPFDLLPVGARGRMLVEEFAVSYLPAAALLLRAPAARRVLPWQRQLLAFGDPVPLDSDDLSPDGRWPRLHAAGREIQYAAHEIPGRAGLHVGSDDLKRHLLDGQSAGVPVLHFSTHAAVDTLDPNRSRILFTPESGNIGSRYLFWQEATQLPLNGVDLVTLAACETEGGKFVAGEGIQSFSRAFLAGGARSTVTALWRVADGPTAEFMRLFYRELGQGVPKAESLRRAKVALLRSGTGMAAPQFWAAFVLTGDGRTGIPIRGWSIFIIPVMILAAIAALAGVGLRRWRRQTD